MKRRNSQRQHIHSTRRYTRRRRLLPNCELYRTGRESILGSIMNDVNFQTIEAQIEDIISTGVGNTPSELDPDREVMEGIQHLAAETGDEFDTPSAHDPLHTICESDEEEIPMTTHAEHSLEDKDIYDNGQCGIQNALLSSEDRDHDHTYDKDGDIPNERSDEGDNAMRWILTRAKILLPWGNMFALLSVCGSVRFTVDQYDVLRFAMLWSHRNASIPSYSTVRRRVFPFIVNECFPASRLFEFRKGDAPLMRYEEDDDMDTFTQPQRNNPDHQRKSTLYNKETDPIHVRIVFPTEWAKLDVMTSPLYDSLFSTVQTDRQEYSNRGWSLLDSDVLCNKEEVLNPTTGIFANGLDGCCFIQKGNPIKLKVAKLPLPVGSDRSNLGFQFEEGDRGYMYMTGIIVHTWCVRFNDDDVEEEGATGIPQVYRNIIAETSSVKPGNGNSFQDFFERKAVAPGDICTLIEGTARPRDISFSPRWYCILLHRFCNVQDGKPSRFILWYRERTGTTTRSWITHEQLVRDVLYPAEMNLGTQRNPIRQTYRERAQNTGILGNGEKYVVYRILLYSDDFRVASDKLPSGSAGGCYMLPVNLPPCDRRSRTAVRLLSLTPPGISTNRITHALIPDLIRGTIEGVAGMLPSGEKVRIFLDVIGYVGDYPASCHTIDSMTHTANAPCTLCNFRRFAGDAQRASRYGYTTEVHARNSAACRIGDRHQALRRAGIDEETANRLGMTKMEHVTHTSCPLIALQESMRRKRGMERLNRDGKKVVNATFDAYRSNLVAPDHLLTGLAKNVLSLVLELTPTPQMRLLLDIRICEELRNNGLIRQKTVLKNNGKGLAAMSLSGVFCLLCVAGPVCDSVFKLWKINHGLRDRAVMLLQKLRELVAKTYWNPQRHLDGDSPVDAIDAEEGKFFFEKLRQKAESYVKLANEMCINSVVAAKHLDKPNLHRTLELYTHSLPAFGHASHFMELVFECAHQPLKRCITRSNHKKEHISAVEHYLGNDWKARIMMLWEASKDPDQEKETSARRGLRCLLLGGGLFNEEENSQTWQRIRDEIDNAIKNMFTEPVLYLLKKQCLPMNLRSQESSEWQGCGKSFNCNGKLPGFSDNETTGGDLLKGIWDIYTLINPNAPDDIQNLLVHNSIRRVRNSRNGERFTGAGFDIVRVGDVVQVLVGVQEEEASVITGHERGLRALRFYCIVAMIDDGQYGILAAVLSCKTEEGILQLRSQARRHSIKLLAVTKHIRRVGIIHACEKDVTEQDAKCETYDREGRTVHNKSVLTGWKYHYITRRTGYPPRMA